MRGAALQLPDAFTSSSSTTRRATGASGGGDLAVETIASTETAASRTAATQAGGRVRPPMSSSSIPTRASVLNRSTRWCEVLEQQADVGAVAPRILHCRRTLDYSQRRFPRLRSTYAQALFLHRVFPPATWTDELVRDPEAYAAPSHARLGLGRLRPRAPVGARGAGRLRRGLLHVLRGHRPLPPACAPPATSSVYEPRRWSRTRAALRAAGRAPCRFSREPDPLRDEAPRLRAALLERGGVALGGADASGRLARAAAGRPGTRVRCSWRALNRRQQS